MRTTTDKILAIIPPDYGLCRGRLRAPRHAHVLDRHRLFVRGHARVVDRLALSAGPLVQLTRAGFVLDNLVPVTLGNLVGGVVMVAAVYWFIYLRARPDNGVVRTRRHFARARAEASRAAHDLGETP
jgi:hypothetical protein